MKLTQIIEQAVGITPPIR